MKTVFRHILTLGFILGALFFSVDSYIGKNSAYEKFEYDAVNSPLLSLSLRAIDGGERPYLLSLATQKISGTSKPLPEENVPAEEEILAAEKAAKEAEEKAKKEAEEQAARELEEAAANAQASESQSPDGENPQPAEETPAEEAPAEEAPAEEVPEEEVFVMTSVEDDYFNDALFIGDSRTVGLSEYCQELMDRSEFYAKVSMTIYGFDSKAFVEVPVRTEGEENADPAAQEGEAAQDGSSSDAAADVPMETVTIEEALTRKQFGKIYIMLGINELGSGTTETFCAKYAEVLAKIRERQPDAIIYIQGIMHVTSQKSDRDKVFRNEVINERNEGLKALADGEHIFYIDMNEATDDENGALDSELSFDSVHLKAKSYALWYDYLKNHAYVKMKVSEANQLQEAASQNENSSEDASSQENQTETESTQQEQPADAQPQEGQESAEEQQEQPAETQQQEQQPAEETAGTQQPVEETAETQQPAEETAETQQSADAQQ